MSASAVGIRFKFSSACSMSRTLSSSPACIGKAQRKSVFAFPELPNRIVRIRPGTIVNTSWSFFLALALNNTRVVTNPFSINICWARERRASLSFGPRHAPSIASGIGVTSFSRNQSNSGNLRPSRSASSSCSINKQCAVVSGALNEAAFAYARP